MSSAKQEARRRFYETAAAVSRGDGFAVELDGKAVKTPAGRPLEIPSLALAEAIAGEWNAQGSTIDLGTLPLTKFANTAIDGIFGREASVIEGVVKYAGSDLIFYRATSPRELVHLQDEAWNPILEWAERDLGALFFTTQGIQYIEQPVASVEAVRRAILPLDAFKLAALSAMTSLTGSALIPLAHCRGFLSLDDAWKAAHVDEDWQKSQWGEDFEALKRMRHRYSEMTCASRLYFTS